MKLAIFGGTGRTGQHLVEQALAQGHQVVALARNPAKFSTQHANLTVVPGDAQDPACVSKVIAGADAVLSVLGPTSNEPTFAVTKSTENILQAMRQQGVKRLVISAGAGVGDPNDQPKLFNRFISLLLKLTARNVYEDMLRVVEQVRASDRDWTVVRVPMLTDAARTGQVQVGYVGKGMGPRISRADMADFMLRQVSDQTYLRQAPAISN